MNNKFTAQPKSIIQCINHQINDFGNIVSNNIDKEVVESFGEEWEKFYNFADSDIDVLGKEYFSFLSNDIINKSTNMLDVGCGTGRWSKYLSNKVNSIEAIDPSKAIFFADRLLKNVKNVRLSIAAADSLPFEDNSFDFVMSVGVLHHIPDTQQAIKDCVKKVKIGGYFYVYLYYAFDNRGFLFKTIFKLSDLVRKIICKLPMTLKKIACDVLAFVIYLPIIYLGRFFKLIGAKSFAKKLPLSDYQNKSLFVIRNDSLDRFGTSLEQRFTKIQIREMLTNAGLTDIVIPDGPVHWAAVGKKI